MPVEQGYGGGTRGGSTGWSAEQRRNAALKSCTKCDKALPLTEEFFYRHKVKRFRSECKECTKAARRKWWAQTRDEINAARRAGTAGKHEDQRRDGQLRTNYKISLREAQEILRLQGDACAICKSPDPMTQRWWHVDHDHACCPGKRACGKCIRGLLCQRCNLTLGQARDSVEILRAAADYLEGWMNGAS